MLASKLKSDRRAALDLLFFLKEDYFLYLPNVTERVENEITV